MANWVSGKIVATESSFSTALRGSPWLQGQKWSGLGWSDSEASYVFGYQGVSWKTGQSWLGTAKTINFEQAKKAFYWGF